MARKSHENKQNVLEVLIHLKQNSSFIYLYLEEWHHILNWVHRKGMEYYRCNKTENYQINTTFLTNYIASTESYFSTTDIIKQNEISNKPKHNGETKNEKKKKKKSIVVTLPGQ